MLSSDQRSQSIHSHVKAAVHNHITNSEDQYCKQMITCALALSHLTELFVHSKCLSLFAFLSNNPNSKRTVLCDKQPMV